MKCKYYYLMKCKYYLDGCLDGRNEFDGLCSIEACERSIIKKILFFGIRTVYKFKKFMKRMYNERL